MELLERAEATAHALGRQMHLMTAEVQSQSEEQRERLELLEVENDSLKDQLSEQINANREIKERYKVQSSPSGRSPCPWPSELPFSYVAMSTIHLLFSISCTGPL